MREALLHPLAGPGGPPVVAIIAPAGYGKSTLLGQWAATVPRVAYLRLDEGDDDPVVLLSDIAGAIRSVEPLEGEVLARVPAPGSAPSHIGFKRLLDALSCVREPLVLMFDDLHQVTSRPSKDALDWLMQRVRPPVQLVVAGRPATAVPIARLAAHDELFRVDERDLRFDSDHIRSMAVAMGVGLSEIDLAGLQAQTEGWPVAVYLVLLAMRSGDPRPEPRRPMSTPLIADFVRAELLDSLEPDDRSWLLRASVLKVLSGPLCDAALDTTGSLARLRRLEGSNLLIHQVDLGDSSRLHPILREVVREELELHMPGAADQVLRRASAWCAAHGYVDEAIEYAHATGDLGIVATLVARHAWTLHWAGRLATIDRWVRWFDKDGVRERYPALAVVVGFMYALEGRRHEADLWLAAAARSPVTEPMPDGSPDKDPWVAMLRGMTLPAGTAQLQEDVRTALAWMAGDSPFMPGVRLLDAVSQFVGGSMEGASRAVAEAVEVSEARGAIPGLCIALGLQASISLRAGEVGGARRSVERGLRRIEGTDLEHMVTSGLLYATGARVALAAGSLEDARTSIGRVNRLRPRLTASLPWLSVLVRLETIQACLALADAASARTLLLEVDDILHARPDLGILTGDVATARRAVEASRGPGAGHWTLTAAELRLLMFLPTHLSFGEIAERLFVTRSTIKSQANAIYGKLGASSRSEAIDQAVAVGLLDQAALRYPPTLRLPVDRMREAGASGRS